MLCDRVHHIHQPIHQELGDCGVIFIPENAAPHHHRDMQSSLKTWPRLWCAGTTYLFSRSGLSTKHFNTWSSHLPHHAWNMVLLVVNTLNTGLIDITANIVLLNYFVHIQKTHEIPFIHIIHKHLSVQCIPLNILTSLLLPDKINCSIYTWHM